VFCTPTGNTRQSTSWNFQLLLEPKLELKHKDPLTDYPFPILYIFILQVGQVPFIAGWDKLILGSVSDGVVHRVKCPILIVR